ncbi:MAG: iron-sulfur cluster assembly accessory protein [Chlamydiae bacterium]|nr:iron-sulfur cluster assembly accessory protein [Chlamydiota bacterium]
MITKEMTIEEILGGFPHKSQKLAQELTQSGLHCVGCGAATWETLESGVLGHGFSEEDLQGILGRLNAILEEETDPSTITMTARAAKKFLEILQEEGEEACALRFGFRAGGCSGFEYVLDFSKQVKEDDEVFVSEGVEIHVNRQMVGKLLGSEIDYTEGLNGAGFKISNPNAKSSCGCGKSQSY